MVGSLSCDEYVIGSFLIVLCHSSRERVWWACSTSDTSSSDQCECSGEADCPESEAKVDVPEPEAEAEDDGPDPEVETDAATETEPVLREGHASTNVEFSCSDGEREPEYGSEGFEQSESEYEWSMRKNVVWGS